MLIVGQAPFGRSGFFGALRDCAKEYFANFTWENDLFECKYPRLAHAMAKGKRDPDYGKDTHKQKVWGWAKSCPLFFTRLENTKEGRWFQIVDRSLASMPHWPCVDLVGSYMGTVSGWRTRYMQSACLEEQIDAAESAVPAQPPTEAGSSSDSAPQGGVEHMDSDDEFLMDATMPGSASKPDVAPKAKLKATPKQPAGYHLCFNEMLNWYLNQIDWDVFDFVERRAERAIIWMITCLVEAVWYYAGNVRCELASHIASNATRT